MIRSYDSVRLNKIVLENRKYFPLDFYCKEWLDGDHGNIFITDSFDNCALFEYQTEDVYKGHYFFKNSKPYGGPVELGNAIIAYVSKNCDVKTIVGLTPIKHKPALWLSRKLGFEDLGITETDNGPCNMFIMKIKD